MRLNNKKLFWQLGMVFLAVFFVFFDGHTALAAEVSCSDSKAAFKCSGTEVTGTVASWSGAELRVVEGPCVESSSDCVEWCDAHNSLAPCVTNAYNPATGSTDLFSKKAVCKNFVDYGIAGNWFMDAMKGILYGIFKLLAWFLGAAVGLFAWMVDSKNVSYIMGNPGLYASWAMVRDFLNLGFILVLLYIAFCVIFQIGSYSDGWKKMLLMMVIMALLVNFSFPISRFIIDVSNITFYYLVDQGFGGKDGNQIMTMITENTGLAKFTSAECSTVSYLLAMIIFTFILMLTFLVIGILFVVRMVAIGILIIFSPIGFAGAAFPFSKKYASDWWDNLFKYSFFAPIMIFMIIIAVNIFANMDSASFDVVAQTNLGPDAGIDAGFIGKMSFFSIPIVILWYGMAMAQKMSIMGASAVTGGAQKFAKWAGKQTYKLPWKGAKYASERSGVTGAVKARLKQFKDDKALEQARRDSNMAGVLGVRGAGTAYQQALAKRVKESAEHNDTVNMDNARLRDLANSNDQFDRAAAMQELANRGKATQRDIDNMGTTFGETSQVFKQLQNKIKTYDPAAAFAHLGRGGTPEDEAHMMNAVVDHVNSNQFDHKKLNNNSLGNANFMAVAFDQNALDAKKMDDIRNAGNASVIDASLTGLATSRTTVNDANKRIHMAALAQTGNVVRTGNAASDSAFVDHVVSKADKDTWKRAKQAFVNDAAVQSSIATNMRPNRIKQIITNMDSSDAQADLAAHLRTIGGSPNADRLNSLATRDHDLMHL